MIILDTNVLSSIMQDRPDPLVASWLNDQARESVWSTAISVYELRFGLELFAKGRKRRNLEAALDRLLDESLEGRVLAFELAAADEAGRIAAEGRRAGQPREIRDVQIAGIARSRRAALATRNVRHFEGVGLSIVNPWSMR